MGENQLLAWDCIRGYFCCQFCGQTICSCIETNFMISHFNTACKTLIESFITLTIGSAELLLWINCTAMFLHSLAAGSFQRELWVSSGGSLTDSYNWISMGLSLILFKASLHHLMRGSLSTPPKPLTSFPLSHSLLITSTLALWRWSHCR